MDLHDILTSMRRGAIRARVRARETGQDPNDMLIAINGKDEQPQSIQEFNAAGKTMPFMCLRVDTPDAIIVPGSMQMVCDGCRAAVWISPETLVMFGKIERKVIVCNTCFLKDRAEKGSPR
jgi:hypothetical protein